MNSVLRTARARGDSGIDPALNYRNPTDRSVLGVLSLSEASRRPASKKGRASSIGKNKPEKANGRESRCRQAVAPRPFEEVPHALICLIPMLHKGNKFYANPREFNPGRAAWADVGEGPAPGARCPFARRPAGRGPAVRRSARCGR